MSSHTPRTFEVPAALVAAGFADVTDLDTLDREVEFDGDFGDWAEKVLLRENTKTLQDVCGDMRLLPRGILSSVQLDDGSLLIDGLVDSDGRVWDSQFNAWGVPSEPVDVTERTIILEDDEVAYVARALREGADEVWFRPYIPKAFVSSVVAAPPPPQDRLGRKAKQPDEPPANQEVPAGSAIVAVVDPIDEDAVLEMLAITPGPRALRRHDGGWFEDPAWVPVLKSVRPPKIVKLNEGQVASVAAQVDRATADQDWEPFDADSREQYQIFTASAMMDDAAALNLPDLEDDEIEETVHGLIAVAGRELTPEDIKNTERLKRYWTVGRGAAKIRWGTPGAWTRCYRNVVKHMPPNVAKGYCTNLSQRLGGPGIATHVTSSADLTTEEVVQRSPYLQKLQNEADERALFALIAVAGRELSPKDVQNTERLKRYWTVGKGAAKIRWGTPGSWRRCYRHLVKYVGPKVAPGLCTNLAERLGGHGIATHVTEKHTLKNTLAAAEADALVAANPSGENGYDNGQTFNEGSASRDYHGRFSSGGSSNRSARAKRRSASMSRSKKARDEKEAKKADSEAKKAEAAAKKAAREQEQARKRAQQEELAQMSVEISEASAAGDTIRAAELRVARAQKRLSFADTAVERANAQVGVNNAIAALERARKAARRQEAESGSRSSTYRRDRAAYDEQYRQLEPEFEARHGRDGLSNVP